MELKDKSEKYLTAADKLADDVELNITSIHCAYYGCYQLLLHYIDELNGITEEERKEQYEGYKNSDIAGRKLGLHEYWIKEFSRIIFRENNDDANNRDIDDVINKIKELKEFRAAADYTKRGFTTDKTRQIINNAKLVVEKINYILE